MESVLQTTNIVKKYGERIVLDNINMNINKGDIYGFIGKNGAGKTTLMRVALSLASKNSGDVKFFGGDTIEKTGLRVGSLIEAPGLYKNASAYENLKRFSILYGADESKIDELLKLVGLKNTGKRKTKDFSLGMRQRLGIAIALLGDPELLILDEPINGLDPEGIKEVRDVIVKLNKEKGITFLISSHLLDELSKIVTKYGIINNGVLVEEIEAKDLKEKCKHKLTIETQNLLEARKILLKTMPEKDIVIKDNALELYSHVKESADINRKLVNAGVEVSAIYPSLDSLEDYFVRKIGG